MFYSTKEVAEKAGVSVATVYGQLFVGNIPEPKLKVGASRVFSQDELVQVVNWFKGRERKRKKKSSN